MIVFDKTSFYLQSLDENGKQAAPNSFTIKTAIPPQSKKIWSQEQVEDIQVPTRGLVVSNLLMAFFFKVSLSTLFGSIISLQILAHLPLAEI